MPVERPSGTPGGGPSRHALANTRAMPERHVPTRVPWLDAALDGGISDYSCCLLAGSESCGKTTLALMALAKWPGRRPLIISAEQGVNELSAYATRLGMRGDAEVYGEDSNIHTARHVIRLAKEMDAGAIMYDSATYLKDESDDSSGIMQLKSYAARARVPVIVISQVNAKGVAEGRRRKRHEVTTYWEMWRDDDPKPEQVNLRYFRVKKTRHSHIDAVTVTLRKRSDGYLEFESMPSAAPVAPAALPAAPKGP